MRGAIVVITLAIMTGIVLTLKFHAQSYLLSTLQNQALEHSIQLQTDDLKLQLLTLSPGVTLNGLSMTSANYDSEIHAGSVEVKSGWGKIATGSIIPDEVVLENAKIWLQPSDLPFNELSSTADESAPALDPVAMLVEPLHIPDTNLRLNNVQLGIAAPDQAEQTQVTLTGKFQSTKSSTLITMEARGNTHQQPFNGSLSYRTSQRTLLGSGARLQLEAEFADSTIASQIVTAKRKGSDPATATIVANGYNLNELMAVFGGPAIDTSELSGKISIGRNLIKASDVNLSLGQADLRADLEINTPENQTPDTKSALLLHVRSDYLPLDELLPHEREFRKTVQDSPDNSSDKVFSVNPPALYDFVQRWDANVQFNASKIHYQGYEVTDLFVASLIKDSTATFSLESPNFASGTLTGKAQYDAQPDTVPGGYLTVSLHNMNLDKFNVEPGVSDILSAGTLTSDGEFWFSGFSTAALAASLDGDIYALLEEGQLDSMAVELAGADIMESLRLLWRSELQQIDVSCGYASAHFNSGVGELEHFLIDSADTLFTASGNVDLDTEAIDITFKPIPHDASLLTATTPINIRGTLASPKIRPGTKLYARVAAAAVLVSLTGPAAALIPFIGVGDGGESSSCGELFSIH